MFKNYRHIWVKRIHFFYIMSERKLAVSRTAFHKAYGIVTVKMHVLDMAAAYPAAQKPGTFIHELLGMEIPVCRVDHVDDVHMNRKAVALNGIDKTQVFSGAGGYHPGHGLQ